MKKNRSLKQVLALTAIILLCILYIASLVLAFIHNAFAQKLLLLTIVLTVLIPVVTYFIMMFCRLSRRSSSSDENGD